jgi:hypothetical protein
MKLARFLGLAVILTGVFFAVLADGADTDGSNADVVGDPQYVMVKKPSVVYTRLDPKSEVIRMVKKGDYLELLSKGDLWFKVKVDGRVGYLETKTGKVVNRPGGKLITLLLYVVILLGGAGGVVLYIKKQQIAPSAAGHIDDDLDDDDLD